MRVRACGCCRTDLHVVEGDLELTRLPIVPGHQVVGTVDALGEGATGGRSATASAWPGSTGRTVRASSASGARRTSASTRRSRAGRPTAGTRTRSTVPEEFAVTLPGCLDDLEAAPLLCAGVIGYRALRRAEVEPGDRVALFGFGASAHLVIQVLHHWGCEVVVLTRGERHRELARELGAVWVGDAAELPPSPCDRAVVFAPAGELVPVALDVVRPGGTVSARPGSTCPTSRRSSTAGSGGSGPCARSPT